MEGFGFELGAVQRVVHNHGRFVGAGDQHVFATEIEQLFGALIQRVGIRKQLPRFARIRRRQSRQRQQFALQRFDKNFISGHGAAAGCQNRINHQRNVRIILHDLGNGADHRRVGQQADLDHRHVQVAQNGQCLGLDQIRLNRLEFVDVGGVLHRQDGDHRGAMAAEADQGFDISRNASAAGGVVTRKTQDDRRKGAGHDLRSAKEWTPMIPERLAGAVGAIGWLCGRVGAIGGRRARPW